MNELEKAHAAHIAAMERAWLWMENQADGQSKGGHATFDLMTLREERDALRAAIDAAPQPAVAAGWVMGGYSAADMAAQGAEQFRAGQASMLAAGERKPLDAAQRRALLESVDHYNFPGDLIRATEAAHGIAAQQGDA